MKPTAVFYHCRLSGGRNVDTNASVPAEFARQLFKEQMDLVVSSGLYDNANEIYICLNGSSDDMVFASQNRIPGSNILWHGENAESLLPTFLFMENWVKTHPDWNVCFFHTKGVTHPGDGFIQNWRKRLENHVILNWKRCVSDLNSGYDTVGSDWKSPEKDPIMFYPHHETNSPYWAGVFWWANSDFMATLPPLIKKISRRHDWYAPELWIGSGIKPRHRDYST